MDDLEFAPLPDRAAVRLSPQQPGEQTALIDHLTPTGQRALLLLVVLLFLDFAVSNIHGARAHNGPLAVAPRVFVAAAPVSPRLRVGSVALREMPASTRLPILETSGEVAFNTDPQTTAPKPVTDTPTPAMAPTAGPQAPASKPVADLETPGAVASGADPQAHAPAKLTDLETPGDVALGADPVSEDRVSDDSSDTQSAPLKPRTLHHPRAKRLADIAHPAVAQTPVAKPAPSAFLDSPPSIFLMTSVLEERASRPQPIFNY
jgi:hypothetical protein